MEKNNDVKNKMQVLYSSDDKYSAISGVSIISLLENTKDFDDITIHYIDCGLSGKNKAMLKAVVDKYGRELIFYPLKEVISYHAINAPKPSYYGRFFAPFFINADKVLYLDCDVLVVEPVRDLWEIDIAGYGMAAVQELGVSAENRAKLNIPMKTGYVNSGMLLMNLDYWRANALTEKLVDFLNKNGEIPPYHDQNIINAVCYKDILIIHPKYNLLWNMLCAKPKDMCRLNKISYCYSDDEISDAATNPVIIHFSNSIYGRPWRKGCTHKYRDEYLHYKKLSPWKKTPLEENKISIFRKLRNRIYRMLPSRLYCFAQTMERWVIKNIILRLPSNKLSDWVKTYMNGK